PPLAGCGWGRSVSRGAGHRGDRIPGGATGSGVCRPAWRVRTGGDSWSQPGGYSRTEPELALDFLDQRALRASRRDADLEGGTAGPAPHRSHRLVGRGTGSRYIRVAGTGDRGVAAPG